MLLSHQDYTIGAWIERSEEAECPAYYPLTILFYLRKGTMHIREGQQRTVFKAPSFILHRRNSLGYYQKSWTPEEGAAQTYLIAFNPRFIQAQNLADQGHKFANDAPPTGNHIAIPSSAALIEVFANLETIISSPNHSLSEREAYQITETALYALLKQDPSLYQFFLSETKTQARGLREIIDHIYSAGRTIEELAQFSGRSLSGFYREFKQEFGATPHKWIMERRLLEAFEVLQKNPASVTRVALDLGFKDLPHFSRRFKRRFGVTPSSVLANNRPGSNNQHL